MIIAYCVICVATWIVGFWLEAEEIASGYVETGFKLFFFGLAWPIMLLLVVIALAPDILGRGFQRLAKKVVKFKEGRKP